jgi:mono/diheme cytochrome c family protein
MPAGAAILAGVSLCLAASVATAEEALHDASRRFLETHCLRCHNDATQEGDFRLDNLSTDFTDPQAAEKWSEVVFRINAAEMPPPEEPQPKAEEIGEIADAIMARIREGAAARMARRGPLEHYRLSRQEYAHTAYDLLGVVFDVEAPGTLNEDPRWHGFERIGALLSVAPSHIDRYFKAADAIVELAFPDGKSAPKTVRKGNGEGKRKLLQLGEGWDAFNLQQPGRYRIRIHASGLPAFSGRVPRLSLWHQYHKRSFAGRDLAAAEDQPETVEFEGLFPAGSYQIRNHARTQKHPNGGVILFRNETIDAGTSVASLQGGFTSSRTKVVDEQGRPAMPLLLVDWVEIEGPLLEEFDQAKRSGVFPDKQADLADIRDCLRRFAERAWRRPVTDAEIEPYAEFFSAEQQAGESFRAAYKSALASVLVARSFFNLEEGSATEQRPRVNDFELASRLSYFLWNSMPDEELFAAARSGQLHSPEKLAEELDRMIADPKFNRFLDSFPRQWLQLHRVGMFQPDPSIYPEYDPWLEESMLMETTGYFAEMVRNNLPLREAVDSDWTLLNTRLAIHYGLPAPKETAAMETDLSRVPLPAGSGRGGMLTHASILSLTSDGTRHRPVHRGAWVSEAIFARTPPPPPPNVDPLEPVKSDEPKTTIRAQLKAHATSATCVSCHAKIDPLGLAFENFDAIGRWRDTERVEGGTGDDPPVDASGVLPDGQTFAGPAEFKKLLADSDDRLAEAFVEQLATYALRRVMTVDDVQHIGRIVASAKDDGYRVTSLIRGLVLSELFQRR